MISIKVLCKIMEMCLQTRIILILYRFNKDIKKGKLMFILKIGFARHTHTLIHSYRNLTLVRKFMRCCYFLSSSASWKTRQNILPLYKVPPHTALSGCLVVFFLQALIFCFSLWSESSIVIIDIVSFLTEKRYLPEWSRCYSENHSCSR